MNNKFNKKLPKTKKITLNLNNYKKVNKNQKNIHQKINMKLKTNST